MPKNTGQYEHFTLTCSNNFSFVFSEQMHPCQFLAFGLGPRVCLGAHFANFEGKMLLNHLISKYKVEMSEATDDPLNLLLNTVIINPDKNIRLKFTPLK